MSHDRPVVCLCGALAGGKTTLIRRLSTALDDASILLFDEYDAFGEWPENLASWLEEGCDPSRVRVPRLCQDLAALVDGRTVEDPSDGHTVSPSHVVLVEDPFGRTRPDIRSLYDLVLYIDLPADLSVARLVRRALGLGLDAADDAFDALERDELVARCRTAQGWLANYAVLRDMYTVLAEPVRTTADAILDGRKPPEELVAEAMAVFHERGIA